MSLKVNFDYEEGSVEMNYLEACASARNMSRTALIHKLVAVVLRDKLVNATLDDADVEYAAKVAAPREKPRRTSIVSNFNQDYRPNIVRTVSPQPGRRVALTKSQMRDQLTQAVVNTGGHRISLADRKVTVVARIMAKGRVCMSDMGVSENEIQRWYPAFRELMDEGMIYRNEPDKQTRRVYYELCPQALPVEQSPSPMVDGPADKDHIDIPAFLPERSNV